ncbi:MAG: energy-coupling factor transporter transmembrane protein EcfT [Cyanobium sp. 49614_E6]|nr:energy-coupling factor transporter transmembrane protein EcfT [Cyanobium sp. 49614_E6]
MDWLRQLPIGQYVADQRPKGGWLQRLDPRLKLAWTLAFLLTPILAGPFWRLTLVGMLLLITLASGLPLRLWRRSLPGLMALALAVGLLGALLPASTTPPGSLQRPPSELRLSPGPQGSPAPSRAGLPWEVVNWGPLKLGSTSLGPLVITRKSATLGINSGTLLFTVIHSANLLLLTTPPEEVAWALGWFLQPLSRLGLPMERLGFTLLLSLRFLPLVQEELQNLLRALATRAINLRSLGWQGGLGVVLAVGERLLANVLLRAEQGADALMARGGQWLPPALVRQELPVRLLPTLLGSAGLLLFLVLRGTVGQL